MSGDAGERTRQRQVQVSRLQLALVLRVRMGEPLEVKQQVLGDCAASCAPQSIDVSLGLYSLGMRERERGIGPELGMSVI